LKVKRREAMKMTNPFELHDQRHLEAAQGWFLLISSCLVERWSEPHFIM